MWKAADRVKETTTTTGTGNVSFAGAVSGFQAFSAIWSDTDTLFYAIAHQTLAEWEVGYGTYNSGANTLSRSQVLASSNAGALVNFSAGTKDVFCGLAAMQGTAPVVRRLASGLDVVIPPSSCLYASRNYEIAAGRKCQIEAGSVLEIG